MFSLCNGILLGCLSSLVVRREAPSVLRMRAVVRRLRARNRVIRPQGAGLGRMPEGLASLPGKRVVSPHASH